MSGSAALHLAARILTRGIEDERRGKREEGRGNRRKVKSVKMCVIV